MFKRKLYEKLLEWKATSQGRTAALIEGARRIGKSTVAEAFARAEYRDHLVLDFAAESEALKDNFRNIGDPNTFFRNLFLLKGKSLPPGESLVIFDEVQLFPPARQAIKALVKDGRHHYLETGSLISIRKNTKDILIPSEEHRLRMHPMDFEEFLWATGDAVSGPAIRQAFADKTPLGEAVHRRIMQAFRAYLAVGGMPQAVADYVDGADYRQIDFTKRAILALYEEDLHKHDTESRDRTGAVFRSLPEQLTHRNARFRYATVGENARGGNLAGAVDFLAESMMVNVCRNVSEPELALELFADNNALKMFMGDTGLLVTQIMRSDAETGDGLYRALVTGKLGVNQGMVMENAVAQMLSAAGHRLYFHEFRHTPPGTKAEKRYEVDFLLVRGRKLCPLEVKSSGYRGHKSFDYFTQKYRGKTGERYILSPKDLARDGALVHLPLYMALCL